MSEKYHIKYTETSLQDISDIGHYISADNKQKAVAFCDELMEVIEQLEDFPYLGVSPRFIEYKIASVKMLPYKKYLIFYVLKEKINEVIILRIIHSSLNYKNFF